ncbi:hypothetical protein [Nocardia wallacei]|uniref:hypothetical protein n=1 Tax=Nocardia wallacei TaxID=480035 RepID=UPI002457A16A|nr:hypothetical protein [Nocardia wallacei]
MSILYARLSVADLREIADDTDDYDIVLSGHVGMDVHLADPYAHHAHLCDCAWRSYVANDPALCQCPGCVVDDGPAFADAEDHYTDLARDMEFDL